MAEQQRIPLRPGGDQEGGVAPNSPFLHHNTASSRLQTTKTAPRASLLVPQRNQRIDLHCQARWNVAGKPAPVPDPFAGRQSVKAGQADEIAVRQRPVKPLNELG